VKDSIRHLLSPEHRRTKIQKLVDKLKHAAATSVVGFQLADNVFAFSASTEIFKAIVLLIVSL
jgi:hypothetical protein